MTSLFACGRFSKSRGLSASVSFLPSFPFPFPLFYSRHSSSCNSLLPNCTETLATQANLDTDSLCSSTSFPGPLIFSPPSSFSLREGRKMIDTGNEVVCSFVIMLLLLDYLSVPQYINISNLKYDKLSLLCYLCIVMWEQRLGINTDNKMA